MYSFNKDELPEVVLPVSDRKQEKELLQKFIDEKQECYNLTGYTGIVSLDEIFKLRESIEKTFEGSLTGSGIQDDGFNVGIRYDNRDWMCEVRVDERMWKEGRRDKGMNKSFKNQEDKNESTNEKIKK